MLDLETYYSNVSNNNMYVRFSDIQLCVCVCVLEIYDFRATGGNRYLIS